MDIEQFTTAKIREQALWLMEKMYDFYDAYGETDIDSALTLCDQVGDRKKKLKKVNPALSTYMQWVDKTMRQDLVQPQPWTAQNSLIPDVFNQMCTMNFESFAHAALMIQGMTLEQAKDAYAAGVKPSWQRANPFST